MAERDHIRNPVEWTVDQIRTAGVAINQTGHAVREHGEIHHGHLPAVRHISVADLREVLLKGLDDFAACRTDVMFICIIYPLAGLLLALSAFNYDFIPLLFPLASGFALLGPVAAIGLYGVLAYSVAQRTREIGVRMALGADGGRVRRMMLRQVTMMTLIGGAVGLAGAVALGKAAQSLLFQMKGSDPLVFATAAVVLIAVAFVAGLLPAQRAARIDPMIALRNE